MLLISFTNNTSYVIVNRIEKSIYQLFDKKKYRKLDNVHSIVKARKEREKSEMLAIELAFRIECRERRMLMMRAFR